MRGRGQISDGATALDRQTQQLESLGRQLRNKLLELNARERASVGQGPGFRIQRASDFLAPARVLAQSLVLPEVFQGDFAGRHLLLPLANSMVILLSLRVESVIQRLIARKRLSRHLAYEMLVREAVGVVVPQDAAVVAAEDQRVDVGQRVPPGATPAAVVQRLNAEFVKALQDPQVRNGLTAAGMQ
jgi:hypothetical protein